MPRVLICTGIFLISLAALGQTRKKYDGPVPPKADIPYLLHASRLVETEAGEAVEEERKDDIAHIVKGAASPARTPLAEPIFLMKAEKLAAEKLELYQMTVKKGQREVAIPKSQKRSKNAPRPLRLAIQKLDDGLFRIEANQGLDNGEYCLTPAGSQQVFCFQVY